MSSQPNMDPISLDNLDLERLPTPDHYVLDDHADPNHPHYPGQLNVHSGKTTRKWTRKKIISVIIGAVCFLATLIVGLIVGVKILGPKLTRSAPALAPSPAKINETQSVQWHTITSTVTAPASSSPQPSKDNSGRPGIGSSHKNCAEWGKYTRENLCNDWCKTKLPQGKEQVCMEFPDSAVWKCMSCDVA